MGRGLDLVARRADGTNREGEEPTPPTLAEHPAGARSSENRFRPSPPGRVGYIVGSWGEFPFRVTMARHHFGALYPLAEKRLLKSVGGSSTSKSRLNSRALTAI
jgi:hypothetical protein